MGKYDSQIQAILNQKAAIEFGAEEPSFMMRTGHMQSQRAKERASLIDETKSKYASDTKTMLINEAEAIDKFYENSRKKD